MYESGDRRPDRLPDRTCLQATAEATHRGVLEHLAAGTPESGYIAIARLSGHLAAMRRAVCTPVRKRPACRELVAGCCAEGRRLEWALRLLQCCLAGEVFAVRLHPESVSAHLRLRLDGYLAAERALAAWIEGELPAGDRERLAAAYLRSLARAPTRPHPRGPRTGPGYRVLFAFHRSWDQFQDTTDSRPGVGRDFLAGQTWSTPA
jgi:hypothetical protein